MTRRPAPYQAHLQEQPQVGDVVRTGGGIVKWRIAAIDLDRAEVTLDPVIPAARRARRVTPYHSLLANWILISPAPPASRGQAHDIARYLHGLNSVIDWDQTADGDECLGMSGDQRIVISDREDGGVSWVHYVGDHEATATGWTSEASRGGFEYLRRYIAHVTDGILRNERMTIDPWAR